jgi:dCMP deaminase
MNAIIDCAKRGVSCEGATIYITHEPCENCAKHLVQAGIVEIVYNEPYPNDYNSEFLKDVKVRQYGRRH